MKREIVLHNCSTMTTKARLNKQVGVLVTVTGKGGLKGQSEQVAILWHELDALHEWSRKAREEMGVEA